MYEYTTIFRTEHERLVDAVNEAAREGWRVVSVVSGYKGCAFVAMLERVREA